MSGKKYDFVDFERETNFASRHGTEAGDDPVFDELYELAAKQRGENIELKERLARLEETDRNHIVGLTIAEGKVKDLTARIESVVAECEKQIPECRGEEGKCNPTDGGYCDNCHEEIAVHKAVSEILRVAKGES